MQELFRCLAKHFLIVITFDVSNYFLFQVCWNPIASMGFLFWGEHVARQSCLKLSIYICKNIEITLKILLEIYLATHDVK